MTFELRAQAILFDMDGTLVDSTPVVERAWGRFAEKYGVPLDDILAISHGVKAVDTVRLFRPDIDADVAAAELGGWELTQLDGVTEIPGAAAFVRSLPEGAFAVVTSAPGDLCLVRLAHCDIPIPDVVIAAEDVANGKPHPEPYLAAAARLGVDPADCVVFEDAEAGIQAGLAAGMQVVVVGGHDSQITRGLPRIGDYRALVADIDGDGFGLRLLATESVPARD